MKKIAVFLLFIGLSASAQERMTAGEYRQLAADYSLRIKMSREQTSAAQDQLKAAKTGYFPSLSLNGGGSYLMGYNASFGGVPLKNYNYNADVTLHQNIYAGHSVRNRQLAAQVGAQIAETGEEQALQTVLYNADVAYVGLMAACEQLEVMDQFVEIVDTLYRIVEMRFADGYVSKTDLLMVETRLNEAEMNRIAARKIYLSSLQTVNTMIGVDPSTRYVVDSLFLPGQEAMVTKEQVLAARPDYRMAEQWIEQTKMNTRVTKSQFNPQVVGGLQGVFGTPMINTTGDPMLYGAAYLQLQVPILMWGQRKFSVSASRAAERSAEWERQALDDQIQGEVVSARNDMDQNYRQAVMADLNVQVAWENLDLNTFSYSEGRLPILDVLQSQLAWIQAYTHKVNSAHNYMVATIDYRRAIGKMEL